MLTGSTIDLLWRYRVESIEKLKVTSWYSVIAAENRKTLNKIIRKKHRNGGVLEVNPSLDEREKDRISCNFTSEIQFSEMQCRITEANVEDSAIYGIQLDMEGPESLILNTSDVEVVGKQTI